MGVRLYDEALLAKLQGWTRNTKLNITGVNDTRRVFQVIGDKTGDEPIKLPLITLSRPAGYEILNTNKKMLTFDGALIGVSEKYGKQLNAVPIQINYQLDVYAKYLAEADEYARNLVFNIINYPKVTVTLPYNDSKFEHDSNIRLLSEVQDNSDVPERLIPGQFTRLSLSITIDDAYLFDIRVRDNISIDTEIELQD